MKIGVIGAGAIGMAFAKQATIAGYEVILSNSRGPASLTTAVKQLGGNAKAGTVHEAAEAEIVFVALQWQHLEEVLTSINWSGQTIIDPTNPILPGFKMAPLNGKTSSEVFASWAKGARVVKAFNTLPPTLLGADPNVLGGHRVIFYSGNDASAKEQVATVITRIGFAGIDLGNLEEGGKLQQFPGGPLPTLNLVKI